MPTRGPAEGASKLRAGAFSATLAGLPVGVLALVLILALFAGPPVWGAERTYQIDPHESRVLVQVFRASVFSLLAHDHVFVAQGFAGRVGLDPEKPQAASLQMTIPVSTWIMDPPEERERLDLSGDLDDEEREDIRSAMLSDEVLDGAKYPRVVVTLDQVQGALPDLVLKLRVRIRSEERILQVPAQVAVSGDTLRAKGQVEFLQSEFGIEPYSNLLGLVAVEDRVLITFALVARVQGG